MKLTLKLLLIVTLFVSTTFADDGNMGNGGYADDGNMGNGGKTCTVNCPAEPQSEGTTTTNSSSIQSDESEDDGSILSDIQDYLNTLFG